MIPNDIVPLGLDPLSDADLVALRAHLADGTLRRFGALVNHRAMGFVANALVAWEIGESDRDRVGASFAACDFVSHCYARATTAAWPYSLYTMVHARSEDELRERLSDLSARAANAPRQILRTVREYKKVSPQPFDLPGEWRRGVRQANGRTQRGEEYVKVHAYCKCEVIYDPRRNRSLSGNCKGPGGAGGLYSGA